MSSLYDSSAGATTDTPQGYMGCWTDSSTTKALTGFSVYSTSMSVTSCRSICSAKNLALAGVENSNSESTFFDLCMD